MHLYFYRVVLFHWSLWGYVTWPLQATNQKLQNASSYGQTVGMVIGAFIGIMGEGFIRIGTATGEFFGWLAMLLERVATAFGSLKVAVVDASNTFLNYLLAPIRLVINCINTLIGSMNRIPEIKILQIPQLPQVGSNGINANGTPSAKTTTPMQAKSYHYHSWFSLNVS